MIKPKTCRDCGKERTPENSTRGGISQRRCNACEQERLRKKMLATKPKPSKPSPQKTRKAEEEKLYQEVRNKILDKQMESVGAYYCEICGYSTISKSDVHAHHLKFRSQEHNKEIRHSEQNVIILCPACHNAIHKDKSLNEFYIKERFGENN